jgi:hypothetical protein
VLRGGILRGWSSEGPGGMRSVLVLREGGFATETRVRREYVSGRGTGFGAGGS